MLILAIDWRALFAPTESLPRSADYRLLHHAPLPLVKNGRIIRKNLKSELLTVDDLLSQLRVNTIATVASPSH